MVPIEKQLIALFGGWLVTFVLCGLVLRVAPTIRAIAHPNERSSHDTPTPTLGGISFVLPLLAWLAMCSLPFSWHLAVAAGLLAAVGLFDDLFEWPALLRLIVQMACSAWLVVSLWPDHPWYQLMAGALLITWFVNLCNFMDGIDGIMGAQVLTFALGALLLGDAENSWFAQTLWLMVGCMLGFLGYNWAPAKVFMGDVGSLFLGLAIAAFAVEMAKEQILPFGASVVLLSVFWFDATYTLCVRIFTKQRFLSAHRSHLYQRVAQRKGHLWTTTAYLLFSVGYLLPLAWMATTWHSMQWVAVVLAVAPIAALSWRMKAGRAEARAKTEAQAFDDGDITGNV